MKCTKMYLDITAFDTYICNLKIGTNSYKLKKLKWGVTKSTINNLNFYFDISQSRSSHTGFAIFENLNSIW